jgi:hypothetical protein
MCDHVSLIIKLLNKKIRVCFEYTELERIIENSYSKVSVLNDDTPLAFLDGINIYIKRRQLQNMLILGNRATFHLNANMRMVYNSEHQQSFTPVVVDIPVPECQRRKAREQSKAATIERAAKLNQRNEPLIHDLEEQRLSRERARIQERKELDLQWSHILEDQRLSRERARIKQKQELDLQEEQEEQEKQSIFRLFWHPRAYENEI